MAVNMRRVTEVGRGNRLPKEMNEFAVLAPSLEAVGFFEEVDRQLPMVRRGGFGAAPVVAYLLAFFMSGARGLRPFYEEYREWWPELAALCGQAASEQRLDVTSDDKSGRGGGADVWCLAAASGR